MAIKLAFEEILKTYYSEDNFDYSKVAHLPEKKVCPLCGKEFYGVGRNGSRQRYCNRSHFIPCVICGKPILQSPPSEKYGSVKCACKGECTKKFRAQQTFAGIKEKYGYDNISQVPEFKEKISKAIKAVSEETTKKVVATMTKKYGGMGTASPVLREKIEKTTQERYGVKNPSASQEIRDKLSEICKSPEYQAKYTATSMANWGVDRPSKLKVVQEKMKKTTLERYGVECALQTEYAKERFKQSCLEKYGVENVLQSDYGRERAREGFIKSMHSHNHKISKINQRVAEMLDKVYGIQTEFEFMIGRNSYDLSVLGTNIVLEIDPSYTHSDLPNHLENGKPKDYQLMKTEVAESEGLRCIHIFDWDDPDKIAILLLPRERIYARTCKLVRLTKHQANMFIQDNHIQGDAKGAIYCYGLKYQGEIVEVMTFAKPRYNEKYQWELLRLCSEVGLNVVGGASKLFKQFIKDVDPESIISYCDRAKFTGSVYEKMGMKLHHISEPSKVWSKGNKRITDNLLRQRGFDQLFGTNYGKGTSNEELMINHGWRSVYDCGQLVFEWRK